MDDALKELTSIKYWILNIVTVALSVLATFITDWLKKYFQSNGHKIITQIAVSPAWANKTFTILHLYLVLLSYFSMTILGYYWTPFFMAFFFALDSLFRAKRNFEATKSSDSTSKESLYFAIHIYFKTFMTLWAIPRITYYATEWNYIKPVQAASILIIAFASLWVISRKKIRFHIYALENEKKDLQSTAR